jgi:hypothetical protein
MEHLLDGLGDETPSDYLTLVRDGGSRAGRIATWVPD